MYCLWGLSRQRIHLQCKKPSVIPGSGRSAGEGINHPLQYSWASLEAQLVKNLPAMQETWVQSLGWEDPQRRGRLSTPVFWPGEVHGLHSPWGHKKLEMTEHTFTFTQLSKETTGRQRRNYVPIVSLVRTTDSWKSLPLESDSLDSYPLSAIY